MANVVEYVIRFHIFSSIRIESDRDKLKVVGKLDDHEAVGCDRQASKTASAFQPRRKARRRNSFTAAGHENAYHGHGLEGTAAGEALLRDSSTSVLPCSATSVVS